MEFDDLKPVKPKSFELGQPLANCSIAELKALLAAIEAEIGRVRKELEAKEAHGAAAASIFKR